MKVARIVNAIFWLYIWLSEALMPVVTPGDFWVEKGKQLFRFNSHINDPAVFIGNGIIPFILWLAIDWALRRARRPKTTSEP